MFSKSTFALFITILFCNTLFAQSKSQLHLLHTFKIASTGGWDYLAVQPNSNKLFISHGTQVNIIDKTNGDSLGVINGTTGVHGIAFAPSLHKGYTSNGKINSVTIFDLNTDSILQQLPVGENPDAIFLEPYSNKIITCNGRSKNLTIIDPTTDKVMSTIEVGGKPETAVSNNNGKLFVNIEDKNEIVVINTSNFTVEQHWKIFPGEAPTGLSIDNKLNRLFAACSDNKLLMVLDATNGHIIDSIPIGAGCDGNAFDAKDNLIYTANGEGTITIIKQHTKNKYTVLATIATEKGARTIAMDATTNKLYLPTATFEEKLPTEKRAKIKPNTFKIMVFGY
jgi:YVTN family beta-propeller protein